MKSELLERLLDAGFSKDEIIQLARDEPIAKEVKTDDEKIEHPRNGNPEDENNPETENNPDDGNNPGVKDNADGTKPADDNPGTAFENRLSGIEKRINDLIKAVQTSNVKRDSIPVMPESLEQETDRIMASIIRPEVEKKG